MFTSIFSLRPINRTQYFWSYMFLSFVGAFLGLGMIFSFFAGVENNDKEFSMFLAVILIILARILLDYKRLIDITQKRSALIILLIPLVLPLIGFSSMSSPQPQQPNYFVYFVSFVAFVYQAFLFLKKGYPKEQGQIGDSVNVGDSLVQQPVELSEHSQS